jgi:hypothetical protein
MSAEQATQENQISSLFPNLQVFTLYPSSLTQTAIKNILHVTTNL